MIINEEVQNDIDVVTLSGRFVMANAPDVRERLRELVTKGKGKMLVDMQKVTFIDSSALAVLISAFKEMQLKSGRLILVNSPIVQSLMELTRLHIIFEIMPDTTTAIKNFTAQ